MDMPTLSDQERRWYWELFRCLDVDGREQLPGAQIFEMFLTSGLQPEILNQVLCALMHQYCFCLIIGVSN
jgi:hypothetical protein